MTKQIELSSGTYAIVDDQDYERVSKYKWTLDKNGYVVRKETLPTGGSRKILLHRVITNAAPGQDVDHWDRNPLNNTRLNLRPCTRPQNSMNRGPKPGSSSQYKGVSYDKRDKCWRATLGVSGRKISLGQFAKEINAALTYDKAAFEHFGEFAYLNFPERL